jgi:hypothetical protein
VARGSNFVQACEAARASLACQNARGVRRIRLICELGNLSPAAYAKRSAPVQQRDGARRYTEGSAPHLVALPSYQGSNEARTLPIGRMNLGLRPYGRTLPTAVYNRLISSTSDCADYYTAKASVLTDIYEIMYFALVDDDMMTPRKYSLRYGPPQHKIRSTTTPPVNH